MSRTQVINAEAARLSALFKAKGAVEINADVLQPAGTLLDLYGEDIRARAYVTSDPVSGEQMLRPDFTVPVVQAHMRDGAEPARYTYCGTVFRKQEAGSGRAREYTQVGYEVFDRKTPAASDAEVFNLFAQALAGQNIRVVTGDIGLLIAAVRGLSTSDRRRAALLRHIWRPTRFRALLDRFSGIGDLPEGRAALIARLGAEDTAQMMANAGTEIGLRSAGEVRDRLDMLRQDAQVAAIPAEERAALLTLLDIKTTVADAVSALRDVASNYGAISDAVETFATRAALLPSELGFEGAYGRTLMEYYDGFVFGIYTDAHSTPVATGGRYDALTQRLGDGRSIPAVGGVIRPDLSVEAEQ